jgi:hypothetical protein
MGMQVGVENKGFYFVGVFEAGFEALHFDFELAEARAFGTEVGKVSDFKAFKLLFKGSHALFKFRIIHCAISCCFNAASIQPTERFCDVNSWRDDSHEALSKPAPFASPPSALVLFLRGAAGNRTVALPFPAAFGSLRRKNPSTARAATKAARIALAQSY